MFYGNDPRCCVCHGIRVGWFGLSAGDCGTYSAVSCMPGHTCWAVWATRRWLDGVICCVVYAGACAPSGSICPPAIADRILPCCVCRAIRFTTAFDRMTDTSSPPENRCGTAEYRAQIWLSTLSVVPAEGYLAYVCSSTPDTRSSVVGIPRIVLAIWGMEEHT
jgi:hypothetical protein